MDRITLVLERFIAACLDDERVVAAFLGGSYARGAADAYSDLDLGLITTDEAFDDFVAGRDTFIRLLGEPLFLEDFDLPDIVFMIFSNGVEAELSLGRQSRFTHIHSGPYQVLVDKKGMLADTVFPVDETPEVQQIETLRRQVYWFWHELSHFITAMGRGQLWWAYGQLEALRRCCVTLALLRHDFTADIDLGEPYFKIERAMPIETLAPLTTTFCPLEQEAILAAGMAIVRFYQELALELSQAHGIHYPVDLERILLNHLEQVRGPRPS